MLFEFYAFSESAKRVILLTIIQPSAVFFDIGGVGSDEKTKAIDETGFIRPVERGTALVD